MEDTRSLVDTKLDAKKCIIDGYGVLQCVVSDFSPVCLLLGVVNIGIGVVPVETIKWQLITCYC